MVTKRQLMITRQQKLRKKKRQIIVPKIVLIIKIPLKMIAKRTIVLNQIKQHHQVKIPNQIQVQVETKNQIVQAVMRQIMLQPE